MTPNGHQEKLSAFIVMLIIVPVITFVCCLVVIRIYKAKMMSSQFEIERHTISNIKNITLEIPDRNSNSNSNSNSNANTESNVPPALVLS